MIYWALSGVVLFLPKKDKGMILKILCINQKSDPFIGYESQNGWWVKSVRVSMYVRTYVCVHASAKRSVHACEWVRVFGNSETWKHKKIPSSLFTRKMPSKYLTTDVPCS